MRYLHADLDLDQPRPELTREEMRSGPVMVRADARRIPLPSGSVDVVVTSPPYLKQRVYGHEGAHELGREETVAPTLFAETFTAPELGLDFPEPAPELDDPEPAQWAGGIDPSHAAAMEREIDG